MGQLYYCYDALCGWCYGFSPVITEFARRHGEVPVQVVSGGMITGERIGPIGEVAGYIKQAYKVVEDRCGVEFGQAFLRDILEEGSAVFTSVPAAVAMAVFQEQLPERALEYAAVLQRAIYYDGIEPLDHAAYADRAAALGADREDFLTKMDDPAYLEKAEADFALSQSFGVTGFPTLVYESVSGELYALARGYLPLQNLEANWRALQSSMTSSAAVNE
ncbi:DsbA family protein [Neolewinella sp.]|uniref:DsbA family protein n=1 Tax=Neolewinella sp. TaxID=2993543 RepID=UPI003B51CDD2